MQYVDDVGLGVKQVIVKCLST